MLRRLDAELVRRGLARSRDQARELIDAGHVVIAGIVAPKPATQIREDVSIRVDDADHYVSRGAHKIAGALHHFMADGLVIAERRALDAGASTGGFTQVLLDRGAASVIAVDVGYGQLAWKVSQDPKVIVHDRTNVRHLVPETLGELVDLIVADLSFISLETVLPALTAVLKPSGQALLMTIRRSA